MEKIYTQPRIRARFVPDSCQIRARFVPKRVGKLKEFHLVANSKGAQWFSKVVKGVTLGLDLRLDLEICAI